MTVERWNDEQLDQLAVFIRDTATIVRENSQAIAQNSQAITDLRVMMSELWEGQAMVTQMLVEERETRQEHRRSTDAALDRIDRILEELQHGRGDR